MAILTLCLVTCIMVCTACHRRVKRRRNRNQANESRREANGEGIELTGHSPKHFEAATTEDMDTVNESGYDTIKNVTEQQNNHQEATVEQSGCVDGGDLQEESETEDYGYDTIGEEPTYTSVASDLNKAGLTQDNEVEEGGTSVSNPDDTGEMKTVNQSPSEEGESNNKPTVDPDAIYSVPDKTRKKSRKQRSSLTLDPELLYTQSKNRTKSVNLSSPSTGVYYNVPSP